METNFAYSVKDIACYNITVLLCARAPGTVYGFWSGIDHGHATCYMVQGR